MKKLALMLLALLNITATVKGYAAEITPTATGTDSKTALSKQQANHARLEALDVLMKQKKFPQAYNLADRLVELYEGDNKFDFHYGMAAVETQHYDQALFAFERLVISFPDEPRYRLELARTHFYLNNLIRAKLEFEKVLAQKPPEAVQKNVLAFLEEIADLQLSVQPRFMFALDIAAGGDSNINSATNEDFLPFVFQGVVIDKGIAVSEDAQETASSYWSTLLNFGYLSPLTKTTSYDMRVVYSKRANSETPLFDLDTAMAELGYSFYTWRIRWRAAGRYQFVQLNGEDFLTSTTFLGQASYLRRDGGSWGLSMNYGDSSYTDTPTGDLTQQQYVISYNSAPKKRSWSFSLIFGADEAEDSSNEHNSKGYQGFNFQKTTLWGQRGSRYWMIGLLNSEYDVINPTQPEIRKDVAATLGLGWRFAFTSSLSMRNDYHLGYTDSTLEANTYKRFKGEFGLTYSF